MSRSAATERATTPRDSSDGIVTSTKAVSASEELGVLRRALHARRQIDEEKVELAPGDAGEQVAEQARTRASRATRRSRRGRRCRTRAARGSGTSSAHRHHADPAAGARHQRAVRAGEHRRVDAGRPGAPGSARSGRRRGWPPRRRGRERVGELHGERALADPALARADRQRWRTPARLRARSRDNLSATCSATSEPPSPAMSK